MKLTEIAFPRYNLDKLPPDAMNSRKIDIFAYDVYPNVDDEDLIYFFMSFYYFGLASSGEPSLLDIIIVYDRTRLSVVEHTYPGRDDIKRDGFTFKSDPRDAILEILKIKR